MIVSVYTDASFCLETRAAGWAGYIQSERGEARWAEAFKPGEINNPTHAEWCAILKTLEYGFRDGFIRPGDDVRVFTDCEHVVGRFHGIIEKQRAMFDEVERRIMAQCEPRRVSTQFVNIAKGQATSKKWDDQHQFCDRGSRAAMRNSRNTVLEHRA